MAFGFEKSAQRWFAASLELITYLNEVPTAMMPLCSCQTFSLAGQKDSLDAQDANKT